MQIENKIKGDKRKVQNNFSKLQVCICQMVVLYGKGCNLSKKYYY